MATSVIKNREQLTFSVNVQYTVPAYGQWNTNFKPIIDQYMPQGYRFGGFAGYTTNDQHIYVVAMRYVDFQWSLQLASTHNAQLSKNVTVEVIATPI